MNFKVGQTVRLINNDGTGVPNNSLATVTGFPFRHKDMIRVRWNERIGTDGGYYTARFVPTLEVGEQLLFNFMCEEV